MTIDKRKRKKQSTPDGLVSVRLDVESKLIWDRIPDKTTYLTHDLKYHYALDYLTETQRLNLLIVEIRGLRRAASIETAKVREFYESLIYARQNNYEELRDAIEEKKIQTTLTKEEQE